VSLHEKVRAVAPSLKSLNCEANPRAGARHSVDLSDDDRD
jgi:hypothetical protein